MIDRMRAAMVLAVLASSAPADAAMMEHFDLEGLALRSTAVVVAHRTSHASATGMSHYTVVKTLRGAVKAGADLEVYDRLYGLDDFAVDPDIVLFLGSHGGLELSGMRVTIGGKVFRFEQWNNPGGWTKVPQGKDPDDNWNGRGTAIDRAEFDRELALAFTRVDLFAAAKAIADPAKRRAAMLAIVPPVGPRAPSIGFYVDALTQAIETALADAGDLEGALEATRHDHSFNNVGHHFGTLPALTAIAIDTAKPVALRAAALDALSDRSDFLDSEPAGRAALALFADPSPSIRALAVHASARYGNAMSSDPKEQALMTRLAREGRTAAAALLAHETDERVLFAIASTYNSHPLGGRADHPVAAHAEVRGGMLAVEVACISRGHHFTDAKLVATKAGTAAPVRSTISWECAGEGQGTGSDGPEVLAAGHYELGVDAVIDGKHRVIALGGLTSDGQAMAIDAP